ncbi:uncharacterized protein PgNI_04977 [Pyricularia grisea]|uniref:Uncharacterized protein n=1 Tax=Pyricularia grisea TaxID=148305 RepID=A0A6P8B9G6_PYRGI|nr:uncharacterized protein PgNI_04977 [Pyricularia grisea]TLD12441.1 hypothetical protein PgNI_04977 [Pyricularia grisea]
MSYTRNRSTKDTHNARDKEFVLVQSQADAATSGLRIMIGQTPPRPRPCLLQRVLGAQLSQVVKKELRITTPRGSPPGASGSHPESANSAASLDERPHPSSDWLATLFSQP